MRRNYIILHGFKNCNCEDKKPKLSADTLENIENKTIVNLHFIFWARPRKNHNIDHGQKLYLYAYRIVQISFSQVLGP